MSSGPDGIFRASVAPLAKILTFVPPMSTDRMRVGADGFRFFIVVLVLVAIA
ncbi:MAG: hypothetical protein ACREXS_17565 [Gammaproteobacteria bacterium]